MIQRFTVYRRNISERDTHNELQKNADDMPQYEGVIFTDGSVAIRWLTACRSTSIWSNIEDMLNVHGHPEYGTYIVWYDREAPEAWTKQVEEYERSKMSGEDFTVEQYVSHTISYDEKGNILTKELVTKTVNINENDIVYDAEEVK